MENFDEKLYEEDEYAENSSELKNQEINSNTAPVEELNVLDNNEEDLTTEVLKIKGISDPSKIKFEDESGAIVERSWDSLSRQELINILSDLQPEDVDLDDEEILLINNIRSSGKNVNDYLLSLYPEPEPEPKSYKVDSLSDEEIYALDLLEKVGSDNITDEEITEAIDSAKKNETLFKKTVEGLRNEYIRLQKDEEAQIANKEAAENQLAYNNFANNIFNEIKGLDSFAGRELELSDEDVEELSAFMLNLDDQGVSAFGRAMEDPKLFTKAAFWTLNEDKIVEELSKQIRDNYLRGYEQGKKDSQESSLLVFSTKKANLKSEEFVDDEDWD